jgi:hypothetical protein
MATRDGIDGAMVSLARGRTADSVAIGQLLLFR